MNGQILENNKLKSLEWSLPEIDRSESPLESSHDSKSWFQRILENTRLVKTVVPLLLFIFLIVFSLLNKQNSESPNKTFYTEVIVSPLAIPKGQLIPDNILQIVGIPQKDLSKNQKLQLLKSSQIKGVSGNLIAKKDIPPFKPIFWSDLSIFKNIRAKNKRLQVFYKGE